MRPVKSDHYDALTDEERDAFDAWQQLEGIPVGRVRRLLLGEGRVSYDYVDYVDGVPVTKHAQDQPVRTLPPRRVFELVWAKA